MLTLTVNGEARTLSEPLTVAQLLKRLGYDRRRVAVEVNFDVVRAIINERCVACHAAHPTQEGIAAPPAGVILETPQQIRRYALRIYEQAVAKQAMPAGNLTEMTPEERATLGAWYQAGARTD